MLVLALVCAMSLASCESKDSELDKTLEEIYEDFIDNLDEDNKTVTFSQKIQSEENLRLMEATVKSDGSKYYAKASNEYGDSTYTSEIWYADGFIYCNADGEKYREAKSQSKFESESIDSLSNKVVDISLTDMPSSWLDDEELEKKSNGDYSVKFSVSKKEYLKYFEDGMIAEAFEAEGTKLSYEILVNEDGVLEKISAVLTAKIDGEDAKATLSIKLSDVGSTKVKKLPDDAESWTLRNSGNTDEDGGIYDDGGDDDFGGNGDVGSGAVPEGAKPILPDYNTPGDIECPHSDTYIDRAFENGHTVVCYDCGISSLENHAFGDVTVINPSSCTYQGYGEQYCKECNYSDNVSLEFADHIYESDYSYDEKHHGFKCINCGMFGEEQNHNFNIYGHDGDYHWTMCRCGAKEYVEAHDWEALSLGDGIYNLYCNNPDCLYRLEGVQDLDHTHTWHDGEIKDYPTCTETGIQEQICACGVAAEKTLNMLPHDFDGSGRVEGDSMVYTCICGAQKREPMSGYIDPEGWY